MSNTRRLRHRTLFSSHRRHIVHIDLHGCGLLNETNTIENRWSGLSGSFRLFGAFGLFRLFGLSGFSS
jgi:hypothetical protein